MDHDAQSLYQVIASSVKDGTLPEGFSLPSKPGGETQIRFADGARDGILMYHMTPQDLSEEDQAKMETAVRAASENRMNEAEALLLPLGEKYRALAMIDPLQNWILSQQESLNAENLYRFGMILLSSAKDTELVKLGLSLLELFRTDTHEALKNMVRTIGLSDEFTLFSVFVMMKWSDGNREIFELAKKVHGWGRIHALERLNPENEEQERWILTEGVHNDVLDSYTALVSWKKGRAEEVLRRGPSKEEYAGIRDILRALLDEGPVQGISALENPEEILRIFLQCAEAMAAEAEDYETVREIRIRFAPNAEIRELCERLLHTENCRRVILEAVKSGRDLQFAEELGIEIRPIVLRLLEESLEKNHALCGAVMKDPEYREKVLALYAKNLPLEEMKTGPEETLGLGNAYWRERALEFLMQELRSFPLEGVKFVETGLMCAPVRTRNGALHVLEDWVKETGVPLLRLLPEMQETLSVLCEKEPNSQVKKRMERLLSGTVSFPEEPVTID